MEDNPEFGLAYAVTCPYVFAFKIYPLGQNMFIHEDKHADIIQAAAAIIEKYPDYEYIPEIQEYRYYPGSAGYEEVKALYWHAYDVKGYANRKSLWGS